MRKKGLFGILILGLIMLLVVGCGQEKTADKAEEAGKFTPGTYEGTSSGHGGEITAKVTVSKDTIEKIDISADNETGSIGDGAISQLTEEIINTQSLAVDAVSGASESSAGILEAVTLALEKAGADITALKDAANKLAVEEKKQEDITVDVVVVGSGGAGLSAAVEAKEAGKSVVVLEKMPIIGGNTNRATGGINAAETTIQEENGIKDSKQTFYDDTLKGGHDKNDPELLQTLVDNAPEAIYWLNDMGAGISRVTLSGGATNPRIHTPADGSPIGPVVVNVLSKKLEELDVDILLNTTAKKLIEKDGVVVGVEAVDKNDNPFTVNAKAVILATGGFGANSEMVEQYRPELKGFSTTNHAGATGSGIIMAQEVGADLMQIEEIQIHPTTDPETGYLFTEGLRGDGAILVNKEGKRFTDELLTRDVVSQNILKQTDKMAYLIVNQEMAEENASLAGYIKDGYATKGDDLASLAKEIGIDAATLESTLKTYTQAVKNGKDEEFGRDHLTQTLENGPYYAIPVTPGIHHTMGGLKIDTQTHVLNKEGKAISGLYAAGELTGGVHGGNRIGGNAVADIIVFGRIAGQTAAKELK
ncbi:flavocytochrome c [Paenibacillus sp. GCM10028914]|uniref:flavocytochrome c n=1 Tax=Paenibacillus sp. GCM10028914 TaxID=3273416 RepID=UPI0036123BDA